MTVLNINQIKKSYGINTVLDGFSMNINQGEKVALIGANGSGKTTIFKLITGQEDYQEGAISIKNDIKIGYLSQIPDVNQGNTLYQEMKTVFNDLIILKEKITEIEKKITRISQQGKPEKLKKIMDEYSKLQEKFKKKGGYQFESKIRRVASGLGFDSDELENKVEILSGGEKTRLGLIKLLLSEPDLLLLDEPTNHLDIKSSQWLENYLDNYSGAVVIISHDRYFLDQVVDRIIELENGKAEIYQGNYSYYLEERKKRFEQKMHKYKNQQKEIKQIKESINRLRNWCQEKLIKRAKSMEKRLERMDKIEKPEKKNRKMNLDLEIAKRSGDEVLKVENLSKSFSREQILKNLDLHIYFNQKIAIVGDNGTGKTTLLKIIMDEMKADSGNIKFGASVKTGYYSQEFDGFNPDDDLITALRREISMTEGQARDFLAAFLFKEDEVFKKVSNLSGGEKSRLRLLQLMLGNYNFLIMDEPTNHLDLPSREVLEDTLIEYPGTFLIVSHDRYFLNKVTELTYELNQGSLTKYYGNYDYYREKKEKREQLSVDNNNGEKNKQENKESKSDYHKLKEKRNRENRRKKRLQQTEKKIIDIEDKLKVLEKKMVSPDNLDDFKKLRELKKEYNLLESKLSKLYNKWEEYIEQKQG